MKSIIKDTFNEKRIYNRRILLAAVIIVILLLTLITRYTFLQIIHFDDYQTQSERNRVHVRSVPPKRGLIFDRNGVLLAENQPSYNLTLVKERIRDLDATLTGLQEIMEISDTEVEKFRERLKRHRPFEEVPLKFDLSEEEIARLAVNRHRFPGVEETGQLVRKYPYAELMAHVVGYVGRISEYEQPLIDTSNYAGTHHIGKIGLEKYYESELHGKVGYENVETDVRGKVKRVLDRTDPLPGKDLHLNIDLHIQQVATAALRDRRGSVVALDPNTGAVIAIVSTPSFDPNLFVNGISSKDYAVLRDSLDLPLFNRSLQGQYPPGSTVKPVIGLAGLEAGVITMESVVRDPGFYQLPNDERKYRDWKRGGHGKWIDLYTAMEQSCDVYYYDLAYNLGIDRLSSFASRFTLGEITGIDLPSERSGLLPTREWKRATKRMPWFPGETLNTGIGQGYMLTTPLQLAVMTAVIANRGHVIVPRVVSQVGDTKITEPLPEPIELEKPQHWQDIFDVMEAVVHGRKGTAKRIAAGMQYRSAGKTGTAQVVGIKQDERYDSEKLKERQRDHALYIGFAPLQEPQIAVAVVIENGEHGSSAAAPVARTVMDAYLLPKLLPQKTASVLSPADR